MGAGINPISEKVDLVGRAKIGVRKQAVEIDAELRPKPLAHQITGGGVHVDVNLEEQVVRVQDIRQVDVLPQSHVDVEEVGIAADFHFHEVDRGRVSSGKVDQAWNAGPILEVAIQDNGRHLGFSEECNTQNDPCCHNVVKMFHVMFKVGVIQRVDREHKEHCRWPESGPERAQRRRSPQGPS